MNPTILKKSIIIICILFTWSLFPNETDSTSIVNEKPDSLKTLDKMVITATRTKRLISQTPASVSVISQEEIDVSPAKNVDDLIMSKTGVQVKRVVGIGEGVPSDIIMRGIPGSLGSSRLLIIVDGIPTNASGTPFLILNEIPLDAVKRIEIVRGPFSSLYGANAFSGVVNIITKEGYGKPEAKGYVETAYPFTVLHKYLKNEKSMRASLKESGSDTYWNMEGQSSGGNKRLDYIVSAGYRTVGNYLLRDSAFARGPHGTYFKKNENYDYRDFRLFGKCGVTLNDIVNLEFHGRYFDSDLGYGKTKRIKPDSMDIVIKGQKFVLGPIARFTFDKNIITVRGFFRRLIGEFWNEEPLLDTRYIPGYWKSNSNDWQVETKGTFTIGQANIVTGGIEILGNAINFGEKINPLTDSIIPGSYSADEGINNYALYVQDEIFLFDRLNIVPGLRLDYHSVFGSAISPKLGLSIKITDWLRFRSSVGRAFRAPTLTELYMPDLRIDPDFLLKPNPDLVPEYIWAADGAFEITPIPILKFQLGLFFNDLENLVVPQADTTDLLSIIQDPNRSPGITHTNVDSAWSRGLEFEIEWQAVPWLNLSTNIVWQKTRNERAGEVRKVFTNKNYSKDDYDVPLDYVPNITSDVGIRVSKEFDNFLLETTISESFIGKRSYQGWTDIDDSTDLKIIPDDDKLNIYIDPPQVDLPSYWRTDFGIKCTFKERVWIALNIQNLFNAEFEEHGGSLATGRFATIKIGGGF